MKTINVEISNITEAQAIALEDMFRTWVSLGNNGSSRWTCFYADGDGNFRPSIKVDGKDFALKVLFSVDASGNAVVVASNACPYGWKVEWTYKKKTNKKVFGYF